MTQTLKDLAKEIADQMLGRYSRESHDDKLILEAFREVRRKALQEAAQTAGAKSQEAEENWSGMSGQFRLGYMTAQEEAMTAILALLAEGK